MKLAPKFATCSRSTLKPVFKQGVPNLFSFRQKWGQILVCKGVKSKIQNLFVPVNVIPHSRTGLLLHKNTVFYEASFQTTGTYP